MRITRLGEGVDATGSLADAAIGRCVAVLEEYRTVMDRLEVGRARLVATSAAATPPTARCSWTPPGRRWASTGAADRKEEGALSMAGALADLDGDGGPSLVLDIGGGSTELVAGDGPDDPELAAVSLQLGCVRVAERFLHDDPPTVAELAAAEAMVGEELDRAVVEHPRFARQAEAAGPGRHRHHALVARTGPGRVRP